MARSFKVYGFWAQHENKIVKVDGISCRIKISVYVQRYPYEQQVISIYAEPISHSTEKYKETKRILGDDWSTDVLDSDIEVQSEILRQCQALPAVV